MRDDQAPGGGARVPPRDGEGMAPRRVKHTRSTFLFPDEQPMRGDDRETAFLEEHFGAMAPGGGNAFVLGSKLRGVQWHVYVADDDSANKVAPAAPGSEGVGSAPRRRRRRAPGEDGGPGHAPFRALVEPTVSMEVCMTHLDTAHAKHFVRGDDFISSRHDGGVGHRRRLPRTWTSTTTSSSRAGTA